MNISSVEKDFGFQKSEERILRIGWILMALFLIAGLLGFFGQGALSYKTIKGNNLEIQYDKYLRYSMNSEVIININALNSDSSIKINSDYAKKIKINSIYPQPQTMNKKGNYMVFKFSSPEVDRIVFYIEPIKKGGQELEVLVKDEKIALNQFIYF